MRFWLSMIVLIAVLCAGAGLYLHNANKPTYEYRTAVVHRGDLVSSISATGTLEPEEVVDIGAQVAGQVESFGKDANGNPMDYRSPITTGMLLAKIDDTVYKSGVEVANAEYEQAKTAVSKGEADLAQAKAKLQQAKNNWDRARLLGPSDALSENDYDMYQADFETAKANVSIADAEVAQATNGVPLAKAQLDAAQRSLDYCTIMSPLNGVVLDRRVNIGQTVVASLSTPSLFLLAKDLSRMQIWVSVNEADVGKIVTGAPVTFTCDTFPDKVFDAKVGKVRWNPTMNQNVVLYTVEVNVDNSKNVLIPYLTAKVQFEVAKDANALIVPNMALRWMPATSLQVAPDVRNSFEKSEVDSVKKDQHGTVWMRDGAFVRPVDVKLGVTDRIDTAVFSDDLKENSEIIIGDVDLSAETQKNPFMPPMQQHHH